MSGIWATYIGKIIMTMGISMAPVLELRGAIPMGVASGLSVKTAMIVAIIGNLIPVPFIIVFVRKIFAWIRTKSKWLDNLVHRFERKAERSWERVNRYEIFGLIILVAVPLPGTGAWTGALVAAMLDMRLARAFPAIAAGVVIAGIIVSYITYGASILF